MAHSTPLAGRYACHGTGKTPPKPFCPARSGSSWAALTISWDWTDALVVGTERWIISHAVCAGGSQSTLQGRRCFRPLSCVDFGRSPQSWADYRLCSLAHLHFMMGVVTHHIFLLPSSSCRNELCGFGLKFARPGASLSSLPYRNSRGITRNQLWHKASCCCCCC